LQGSDGDDHDDEWYIDSGFSHHIIGRKNNLKNFRKLNDFGMVVFENNERAEAKGYGQITHGQFTIKRFAYVKGLKHNLIRISQLCVKTGNKVTFDEYSSMIKNKKTKQVLLRSKQKRELYPLDMTPISGVPSICLLSKAHKYVSWL